MAISSSNSISIAQFGHNPIQTDTLDVLSEAKNYNRRILNVFKPFVGADVLEIGCGTGNFSRLLLELPKCRNLTAVDVVPSYVDRLKSLPVPTGKTLTGLCQDIFQTQEKAETKAISLAPESFDTIILVNVLEHLPDDTQAVSTLKSYLKPGGHLIVLVPAFQALFSPYDESIGHYRRYTKKTLAPCLEKNALQRVQSQYFNLVGIVGWWVRFCLQKKMTLDTGSVQLFDRLSPIFSWFENSLPFPLPVGLSLITVAQSPLQKETTS